MYTYIYIAGTAAQLRNPTPTLAMCMHACMHACTRTCTHTCSHMLAHAHAPSHLQVINPSETFGEIMVDYNHVECSSACITALAAFAQRHPQHRAADIARAVRRGIKYIKRWVRRCVGVQPAAGVAMGWDVAQGGRGAEAADSTIRVA